ncbi:NTP transferase domain-containing protein [Candidatus Aerophobetes bacterium]|nr:NTP transferase domain-containing protein [Candidatus Aerophobetes bacterium]
MKAVILAAGQGNRISSLGLPKPLIEIEGLSLLERTILFFIYLQVRKFIIVVGYRATEIKNFLKERKISKEVEITWVENPQFHRGNGVSVLCAQNYVDDWFLLSMVDHLYEPAIFLDFPSRKGDLVCAVDSEPRFADPQGATKVFFEDGVIRKIGKSLKNYNALDCGLFLCSKKIFPVLKETIREGREEWDEAKNRFAREYGAEFFDIKGGFWIDVDTPEDLIKAKKLLSSR